MIRKLLQRVCLIVLLVLTNTSCTSLFFFPQRELVRTPADLGLAYDDVYMTTRDGIRLHAWFIKPRTQPIGSIYFLHGNAENISTHIGSVLWMIEAGYQVFIIDYRGYGLSEGVANVPEVFEDVRTGANWLLEKDPVRPLVILGQSLGASLSITSLHNYPEIAQQLDGLVSEAAFSRYSTIGREVAAGNWLTWVVQYPVAWLLRRSYDPMNAISKLQLPVLLLHSTDDRVIGVQHARDLYAQANEPKHLHETTGGHIQAFADPLNRKIVLEFIQQLGDI